MKKRLLLLTILTFLLSGCGQATSKVEGTQIHLSDESITVDGKEISNDSSQAVYSANDIVFYLEGQDFTYGEGTKEDEHSQKEADAHTVVHITKPGKYVLSGALSLGQNAVDLGEDAKEDPEAVVTLTSKQNDTYVLKNADGEVAFDYVPTNAFTYLIVVGDEIVPSDNTFWQGNTQLMASAVENMPGGMFQGKRLEKPERETPEGELPEMPNGKGQKGERPEFPEGEMPEGELPNGMMPPDMMDGNMPVSGETSTTFTIEKGGNQFAYVSPMESE